MGFVRPNIVREKQAEEFLIFELRCTPVYETLQIGSVLRNVD